MIVSRARKRRLSEISNRGRRENCEFRQRTQIGRRRCGFLYLKDRLFFFYTYTFFYDTLCHVRARSLPHEEGVPTIK